MRKASLVTTLSILIAVVIAASPSAITGETEAATLSASGNLGEAGTCSLTAPPVIDFGLQIEASLGGCPPGFCDDEFNFCISGCDPNDFLCRIGCLWQYESCQQHCSSL